MPLNFLVLSQISTISQKKEEELRVTILYYQKEKSSDVREVCSSTINIYILPKFGCSSIAYQATFDELNQLSFSPLKKGLNKYYASKSPGLDQAFQW